VTAVNRRRFIGLGSSAAIAAIQSPSAHSLPVARPDQNPVQRPNFLFIIADDLMFRTINSINNPEVHTPNLDKLVRSGCHFTHCFHQEDGREPSAFPAEPC
jgi:choline-sulfatase